MTRNILGKYLIFLACLAAACSDSDDPVVSGTSADANTDAAVEDGDASVPDASEPVSADAPRLLGAVGVASDTAAVFWYSPVGANAVFEVHAGASSDFAPTDSTRVTEVTGEEWAEVSGLPAGRTLFLKVVLVTPDGTRHDERESLVLRLPETNFVLQEGVVVTDLSSLGEPLIQGETYLFDLVDGEAPTVENGDYIVGASGDIAFLRRVLSVTQGSEQLSIATAFASPSEVLSEGEITSTIAIKNRIVDDSGTSEDGYLVQTRAWGDGAIRLNERRSLDVVEGSEQELFSIGLDDGLEWSTLIAPTPTIRTSITLDPELGSAAAEVQLGGDVEWSSTYAVASSFTGEVDAKSRPYSTSVALTFWIAGVPITQLSEVETEAYIKGTVDLSMAGRIDSEVRGDFGLNAIFDGIGWSATGSPEVEATFRPVLEEAGSSTLTLGLDVFTGTTIEGLLYFSTRAGPAIELEVLSTGQSACPIDRELQVFAADGRFAQAAGPSIEAPVAPRLSVPRWSEQLFSLPKLQIVGPTDVFRPDGGRFRYGGDEGLFTNVVTDELGWAVTPELEITVDSGVATVVPDVDTSEPAAYQLLLWGHTEVLGAGAEMCALPHTFSASNRQATCAETQVFVVPGAPTDFSVECRDTDLDYPLELTVAEGPFEGRLEEPIPQSIDCDDEGCTATFRYSVDEESAAISDSMVLLPVDSLGLVGSSTGAFGNVQLGFNRAPEADPMTLILDLDVDNALEREVILQIVDPVVAGDPAPNQLTTELLESPTIGEVVKLDELTYQYTVPALTIENFGSPLPTSNLFDTFTVLATDAHDATSEPLEVTAILRPNLCAGAEIEVDEDLAHLSDFCVIEFCTEETCNVECLPRVALTNPLGANPSRYPEGTTCSQKTQYMGTNWGGDVSDATGQVVDLACPCVAGRAYEDEVWLQYNAPAPYDTCTMWPFEWYTVCSAPPDWKDGE